MEGFNLGQFLEKQRQDGQQDSEGSFTVAQDKALDKISGGRQMDRGLELHVIDRGEDTYTSVKSTRLGAVAKRPRTSNLY